MGENHYGIDAHCEESTRGIGLRIEHSITIVFRGRLGPIQIGPTIHRICVQRSVQWATAERRCQGIQHSDGKQARIYIPSAVLRPTIHLMRTNTKPSTTGIARPSAVHSTVVIQARCSPAIMCARRVYRRVNGGINTTINHWRSEVHDGHHCVICIALIAVRTHEHNGIRTQLATSPHRIANAQGEATVVATRTIYIGRGDARFTQGINSYCDVHCIYGRCYTVAITHGNRSSAFTTNRVEHGHGVITALYGR